MQLLLFFCLHLVICINILKMLEARWATLTNYPWNMHGLNINFQVSDFDICLYCIPNSNVATVFFFSFLILYWTNCFQYCFQVYFNALPQNLTAFRIYDERFSPPLASDLFIDPVCKSSMIIVNSNCYLWDRRYFLTDTLTVYQYATFFIEFYFIDVDKNSFYLRMKKYSPFLFTHQT